uniref:Isochorismatase domain-containing protein 1 n=1 Tax=Phallusia mammillata TaxID=59560 RepID=A0A6F9DG03_9ASCI|nr:isochorismatase domain-containing protein 1-like [Phallusia mammillata]
MQKYKGISCKSVGNLSPSTSVVFCCDMQERFKPAIKYFAEIAEVGNRVLKTSEKLGIPLVVTEQYPKGLGKTVEELDIGHAAVLEEKTKFSMMTPKIVEFLTSQVHLQSVVLFGVEAHVCVQQTAHDLITRGYDVHIIADATSSRTQADRHLAFERLRSLGAFVTTCETVLLQWVADKNHPKFKEIQQIIKISPPDTGLIMKSNI